MPQTQLPTRSVDIQAFFVAQGCRDVVRKEGATERTACVFRGALPVQPLHGIVGDEIDFGSKSLCQRDKFLGVLWCIVHTGNENVLQRYFVFGTGLPRLQRRNEFGERSTPIHRHDARANFIRGTVK